MQVMQARKQSTTITSFVIVLLFFCNACKQKTTTENNNSPAVAYDTVKQTNPIPIWEKTIPNADLITGVETVEAGIAKNISNPTITIFSPTIKNSGAAVLVFPGGGYTKLAVDLEGTEICKWLASIGVTGILLKYRVPYTGPHYSKDSMREIDPIKPLALQDAQRAVGLVRAKATTWQINPNKIGVMGFSAGGHLVADVCTNYRKRAYTLTDNFDTVNCRPNFGIVMFPGHMTKHTTAPYQLNTKLPVDGNTPPTFLLQAGNDPIDPIDNSLVYYIALQKAKVHAEYHIYAEGGHAFGLNRTVLNNPNWHKLPIANWENLVITWLQTIKMTTD
jgi:acetyl esterase/lipase